MDTFYSRDQRADHNMTDPANLKNSAKDLKAKANIEENEEFHTGCGKKAAERENSHI